MHYKFEWFLFSIYDKVNIIKTICFYKINVLRYNCNNKKTYVLTLSVKSDSLTNSGLVDVLKRYYFKAAPHSFV